MKILLSIMTLICIASCTYNVSMEHIAGNSTGTIEDTATASPDITPSVALSGLPAV